MCALPRSARGRPAPEYPMPKAGEIDEIWDALTEAFGDVRTPSERGRRNRAVRELREAEAKPEEILIAVAYCRRNFTSFTEMAVCNWFSRSLQEHAASGNREHFLRLLRK